MTWQQVAALIVGALYTVSGIVGFFVLGDASYALGSHDTGNTLLGLELNGIQNIVHLLLGLVGLVCSAGLQRSRSYGVVLAVVGAALFVFGLVAVGNDDADILSLNWPDNILHAVTALIGLSVAAGPARLMRHADQERAR